MPGIVVTWLHIEGVRAAAWTTFCKGTGVDAGKLARIALQWSRRGSTRAGGDVTAELTTDRAHTSPVLQRSVFLITGMCGSPSVSYKP